MRRSWVRRVRHWVANRGWRGLFAEVLRQIRLSAASLRRRRGEAKAAVPGDGPKPGDLPHPFDERYGVETGGLIWGEELRSGERREYWATGYYGISPSVFWQALDRLGLDWGRYSFLDVGCGKGRALMLALRYPFRRVVGVDLSADLVGVARANLERFRPNWRTSALAEAVAGDATAFELPGGPLVLYLYHPFAAPVMSEFLAHLREAVEREPGREVYLLYVNPELDSLLGRTTFLEKLWRECFPLQEEDAIADRFGSREEHVSAYRVR